MRVHQIIEETGCEKLNIIAHSKGGLDSRAMIALTDVAPCIASVTTINTPHRGCQFADYLLHKISEKQQHMVESAYNTGAAKLGDVNPDFLQPYMILPLKTARYLTMRSKMIRQFIISRSDQSSTGQCPEDFRSILPIRW